MKIVLTDIGSKMRRYSIDNSISTDGSGIEQAVPVQAEFTVTRRSDELFLLSGGLQAQAKVLCDRCGVEIASDFTADFLYTLRVEDEPQVPSEYGCTDEDCDTVYLEEPFVETDTILREQIILALPTRCLCDDGCKGICAGCGVNLNKNACQCIADNSASPFAVLKKVNIK